MAQFNFVDLDGLRVFKQESDKIYANSIKITQNAQNGIVTFEIYSKDNTLLDTKTLDLDTEHIIKSVSLDYAQKKLIFTMADDSTLECDITTIIDKIIAIESKIPSEASAQNQLADKQWVNDNGGKIDSVSIDGTPIEPDVNKNVDLPAYPTRVSLGLNNVDNTRDLNKPISNATQQALDLINGKIPSQASAQNQLADKDYVNSSIATNTATFKGTYNSVSDLPLTNVDNNDYAFVMSVDSLGNTSYSRYKYTEGTGWTFEYTLNNSSFTAEQWATINSGMTLALKNQITTNQQDIANIKNGSDIDSFGDVESALGDKADKSNTYTKTQVDTKFVAKDNVINLVGTSGTLTQEQYDSINDYTIINWKLEANGESALLKKIISDSNFIGFQCNGGLLKIGMLNAFLTITSTNRAWEVVYDNVLLKTVATSGKASDLIDDSTHRFVTDGEKTTWNNKQDNNLVTSFQATPDNIHYPSEKLVKDSLDDETTRATSQENKSLYHLGAFDSITGNTITRQTGVLYGKDLFSSNVAEYDNITYYKIPKPTGALDYGTYSANFMTNKYPKYQGSNWNSTECIGKISGYAEANYYWVGFTKGTTQAQALADFQDLVLQYKLATPYTDTPIEGESILPLDSNMANKIRQDVVEGLNLFNKNDVNLHCGLSADGGLDYQYTDYFVPNYIPVKPNTKYTYVGATSTFACYDKNYNTISLIGGIGTLTTPSNCYYVRFNALISLIDTLMVVEADHPYQYEPYHASKHITDDEATLLKQEEKKCNGNTYTTTYQSVWNSDGTSTYITTRLRSDKLIIEGGKTYKISFEATSGVVISGILWDSTGSTNVGNFEYTSDSIIITTPSNAKYIGFNFRLSSGADLTSSSVTSFSFNDGEIVHEKQLKEFTPKSYVHNISIPGNSMERYEFTIFSPYPSELNFYDIAYMILQPGRGIGGVCIFSVGGDSTMEPAAISIGGSETNPTLWCKCSTYEYKGTEASTIYDTVTEVKEHII